MSKSGIGWTAMLAIAAMGSAQAVNLDINGRGQVLLYPYYTVNKGQQTLLSVTNTATVAQAAKVRFREGYNGRTVLDFNIFLSPFDSWSATVFALSDAGIRSDGAAILSRDTSCTAPLFSEDGTSINGTPYVALREFDYLQPSDGGPSTIDRTREGMIEIIAMSNVGAPLAAAITHGSNRSPPTGCAQVRTLLGSEPALSSAPSGGLMGSFSVVNGADGTYLSARAEALAGFTGRPLFTSTASTLPDLSIVNDGAGVVLGNRATARIIDPAGKALTLTYPGPDTRSRRVDAVSAVLMADRIYNEYEMSASSGAASDWVVTMPTKAFHVDPLNIGGGVPAIPPFTRVYNGSPSATPRFSWVGFSRSVYSREGVMSSPGFGCGFFCPPGFMPTIFARSVNVVPIRDTVVTESSVLGSRLVSSIARSLNEGTWKDTGTMRFNLDPPQEPHSLLASAEGKVLRGLPVIGFWASNRVNNIANSTAAETTFAPYAAAVRHATSATCVKASDGTPCD